MTGTVVTFYSYKGGVGRTFALANTAAVVARWGYRTLCVDWDLDAPGLTHYLRRGLAAPPARGVVDLVADHVAGLAPDPADYAVPVALDGTDGRLDLLPAGAEDPDYVRRAQALDWADLYDNHGLGAFLERCRTQWAQTYDVVLVDSRTGITDVGGICTAHLPDVLVMMFTANDQSLDGTVDVARRAWDAQDRLPYDRGGLQIVPVPSRFDAREEYEQAERWRARFATALAPLVTPWAAQDLPIEKLLGHLTVPYVSFWSFGEKLPAVVESDLTPDKIGYSLETLAALVAHRLGRTGLLADSRDSFVAAAARGGRSDGTGPDVFISTGSREEELAGRIARGLHDRSVSVFLTMGDLAHAEHWQRVDDAAADASHLVVLVGTDGVSPYQTRDIERFLRQTLDEGTDRLVIPVLAPGVRPQAVQTLLAQFRAERLVDDGDDAVTAVVTAIVRAIAARTAPDTEDAAVRVDALETLADLTAWQLEALRWQLIAAEFGAVEQAVAEDDDSGLRAAVADLELLGPVRASVTRGREVVGVPDALRNRVTAIVARLGGQLDVATARAAVTARLDRFAAGEPVAVSDDAALSDAARYRLAAGDTDPEAAYLLGLLHHLRSQLRADAADDRAAAVRHFAVVFPHAPDRVPPALRDDVAAAVGEVNPDVRAAWANRVTELVAQGRTSAARSDLDAAVWLAQQTIDSTMTGRGSHGERQAERDVHLVNLVLALRARFRRWGDTADLDAAVDAGSRGTYDGRLVTALGLALVDRYEATGHAADLDAAIEEFMVAARTSEDTPIDPGRLSNLASALATRFLARGDTGDLDAAVDLLRRAVDATPPGRERAAYLANLGAALSTRYGRLGDGRDLDEAVALGEAAAAALGETDPDRVAALSGLGLALRTRFQRTGDPTDLDAAVDALDEAFARAPAGPVKNGIASNLSTALRVRAGATGDPADADRAVTLARQAVEFSVPGDARLPRYLSNLGATLSSRGGEGDLDAAVTACEKALEGLPAHDPLRTTIGANLGLALRRRSAASGGRDDLQKTVAAYLDAARVATAAPLPRAIAAQEWGDAARELGEPQDALAGYATALNLLGQVTDRRLAPDDQQRGLARLGGLGSAAAATALALDEPLYALELLEQGRGVLLAQALDTRGEPGALRAADPELADRFDGLAHRLNDPAAPDRRRLVREWADLLDEIRTRPGFARFLLAPSAGELIEAVGEGPVVAVNVAAERCDALVVRSGELTVVPLPDLTYADAHERAAVFLAAVHGDDPDRDATVAGTLAWLWDAVTAPVLARLDPEPSRIWWMPTGPLGVLPLGAAGPSSAALLDRVVSSTVPTIRALGHARRPRPVRATPDRSTLVVAVPHPVGRLRLLDLPAAQAEADAVAATLPETTRLSGRAATCDAVRAALPRHTAGHFACHATVDLADPSRSGLVLADEVLTVREISAVENADAHLVYLSACSTAFGGATLLDEAVHVAAAFQLAGYRHVIATMWPVGDLAARRFARLTYGALRDGADPASAVHAAAVRTRTMLPDRPSVWAAHVHFGP